MKERSWFRRKGLSLKRLKVAIVGAGITGAYLYRMLRNRGYAVDLFGCPVRTRCGINPCAWGVSSRDFLELVKDSGLDPKDYSLRSFDYLQMDEFRICADLMTFSKPRFVRDLLEGATIRYSFPDPSHYERLIDATGVSRALLPAIEDDVILNCIQYRVRHGGEPHNRVKLTKIGYAWTFPLSEDECHVGCGSLIADPAEVLESLGWTDEREEILCSCCGRVRATAPHYALPFFVAADGYQIWGVGEAIGCVAPLAGDGIVSGIKSVRILLDCWDDPRRYRQTLLGTFDWMKEERRVIEKLRRRRSLGWRDARVLQKNSRRMGMKVDSTTATLLLERLR
jgi:flavin-dependent dehydrogenase